MFDRLIEEINTEQGGVFKKSILVHILMKGSSLIPDIAKELQYSTPTITKYVAELCEEAVLVDLGKQRIQKGRRPSLYGVNKEFAYFVGVDVNRFNLKIGLINLDGEMVSKIDDASFYFEDTPANMEHLCQLVRNFILTCGVPSERISYVNINISGRIDAKTGRSYDVYNFDNYTSSLSATLSRLIGKRVSIENDTRAMTYGELVRGHAREYSDYIFVNLSWGISIGMILGGQIYYGKDGYSGEFGHLNIYDNGITCHCGKTGCLETELSGSALHRRLIESICAGRASLLADRVLAGERITTGEILDALAHEDPLVVELVEHIGSELGRQLAGMVNLFNPEAVIIGGILSEAGEHLLVPLKAAIRKYSLELIFENVDVKISNLKNEAGVIGACMLARHNAFNQNDLFLINN